MNQPRALTSDELRDKILRHMKGLVHYWANIVEGGSTQARIDGAMFSVLAMLDGSAMDIVAFDLVARPHEDDKEYCIDKGENWVEEGTVISTTLHEYWHGIEVDAG